MMCLQTRDGFDLFLVRLGSYSNIIYLVEHEINFLGKKINFLVCKHTASVSYFSTEISASRTSLCILDNGA